MSSDIPKFRIAAALAVAAFMLVVPLAVCFDSDAEIAEDSAGYYVEGNEKATDAELLSMGLPSRSNLGLTCMIYINGLFNDAILGAPVTEIKAFTTYTANGKEVGEAYGESIGATGYDVSDITATYTLSAGKLLANLDPDAPKGAQEAVAAIIAYFGENAEAGDKLIVTGDISMDSGMRERIDYGRVDDSTLVVKEESDLIYSYLDIDYDIKLIKNGESEGKSIGLRISSEGRTEFDVTYTYGKDLKDLTDLDKCTMKTHNDFSGSGTATIKVDGKSYDIDDTSDPDPDEEQEVPVHFIDDATIRIDPDWKTGIDAMQPAGENTEVKKGYSAAESAYNDVKQKVDGKKTNYLPFIIGGVVAVVIIAGVAFFLIKRK